jgi:hypothetical protein
MNSFKRDEIIALRQKMWREINRILEETEEKIREIQESGSN